MNTMRSTTLTIGILAFVLATNLSAQEDSGLRLWQVDSLTAELEAGERPWLGFFRNANLSTGIYALAAGTEDKQSPHQTDEIYYVLEGRSDFECEGEIVSIKPGSILFVPAHATHRFLNISVDLKLLVFFD